MKHFTLNDLSTCHPSAQTLNLIKQLAHSGRIVRVAFSGVIFTA